MAPPDGGPVREVVRQVVRLEGEVAAISPDDARAVRVVRLAPTDTWALAAHDLDRPDAAPRLFALGARPSPPVFLGPRRVLTTRGDTLLFIDVESGATVPVSPTAGAAISGDGARAAVVRPDGASIVDTSSGRELLRLAPAPRVVAFLSWAAEDRVLAARTDPGVAFYDAPSGRLLFHAPHAEVPEGAEPVASRAGRYVAFAVRGGGAGGVDAEVLDLGSRQVAGRLPWARASVGSVAFSADERAFASSVHPSELHVLDLASGTPRTVATTARMSDEGLSQVTKDLVISSDGRYACGRVGTDLGKYEDCVPRLLYDAASGGAARAGEPPLCLPSGRVVRLPAPRPPRRRLASLHATYSAVCNQASTADGELVAHVEEGRPIPDDDELVRPELVVRKNAGGELARVALPPAPRVMGARLAMAFTPDGSRLLVEHGFGVVLVDVLAGSLRTIPAEPHEGASFSPAGTMVVLPNRGCFRALRGPGLEAVSIGCPESGPEAREACLVGDAVAPLAACAAATGR